MSGRRGFLTLLGAAGVGLVLPSHVVFDPGLFKRVPQGKDVSMDALLAKIEAETFRRYPDATWFPTDQKAWARTEAKLGFSTLRPGVDETCISFALVPLSEVKLQKHYVEPVADSLAWHLKWNATPLVLQPDGHMMRGWYSYDARMEQHFYSVSVRQVTP